MRYLLIALTILLCPVSTGYADVSVGVGVPGINIGINMPAYPDLVPVPGIPSTTIPTSMPITSSTTASTGCSRTGNGMRAVGTTDRGGWFIPTTCRRSCCAFRCATIAARRHSF